MLPTAKRPFADFHRAEILRGNRLARPDRLTPPGPSASAAIAVGVDAFQMAQVQDFPAPLRGVPHDGGFARDVWLGNIVLQRHPTKRIDMLVAQLLVKGVIGVHEYVRGRLVIIAAIPQKIDMLGRMSRRRAPGP